MLKEKQFHCPGSRKRSVHHGNAMGNPIVYCDACGHSFYPTKSPKGLVPKHKITMGMVVGSREEMEHRATVRGYARIRRKALKHLGIR